MTEEKKDPNKDGRRFQVADKRFWVVDESAEEDAEVPAPKYPSFVEELKERAELAESRLKTRLEELDQENQAYRARVRKEMKRRFEREKLALLTAFLEVVDNMERALEASVSGGSPEALKEGVELNLQLLLSKLNSNGVEPLKVMGSPFDPRESEAVGTIPTDNPEEDQVVLEVLQNGYRCGDHLLRPARVRVGQLC